METIKTIHCNDETKFDEQVNALLQDGWKISSTYCGFVQSESYDFCGSYHAILIKA